METQFGKDFWRFSTGFIPVIVNTRDNGYMMVGASSVGDSKGANVLVMKISQNGDQLWTKTFAGSGEDLPWSIIEDDEASLVITGHKFSSDGDFSSNNANGNIFVLKLNEQGEMKWMKFYGGNGSDDGRAIVKADDGYFVAGVTKSTEGELTTAYGNHDYFVLKIDKSGRKLWHKSYGGSGIEQLWGAVSSPDDGVVVAGYSSSSDHDIVNPKGGADFSY